MFRKLLKHDWRATAGTLGILTLAALGVSLLGGGILYLLTCYEELPGMAMAGLTISLVFVFLSLIGYVVAVEIIQLVRFYKSRFTDEGYLTFTLPVSSHQIFLSTVVTMLIWTMITWLVLLVCFAVILLIGIPWNEMPMADISEIMEYATDFYGFEMEPAYVVIQTLQVIVGCVYSIVMVLTCLTLGAVIAKKHKIIGAFVAYYVISFLTGIVSSILTVSTSIENMDIYLSSQSDAFYQATIQNMSLSVAWEMVLIVAGYILSTQLMKRKLNLP